MGGKGPPRPSSSESDDWGDESWIVDCPCGVNYDDGEEMVECDECGVWVHTACCRVTKGLPTFVCDKCKIKKKLKESEESEVAQLLADLPSKPVSFEQERNHHEKPETYITGHQNSSEIPIEERVHVQGIPGGDPSFFVGAPEVFGRQLWKYTGYVPKLLKLEYKELPEPQEDVLDLLRGLKEYKEFDAPLVTDDDRKFPPFALENGHATVVPMAVDRSNLREEEVSKEEVQVNEGTLKDKQGKGLQARKGEGKHSKHRHKPKAKEEKPHHHGKRGRDEGGIKEQSSKKKARTNGDVCKPEDGGDLKKAEGALAQETSTLKSPLSSPKNPKAMKKLAVQEFMDGDLILCSVCGNESLVEPLTGGSTGGASDSLCKECERVRRRSSPVSPKQETRSVKQEPVVQPVSSVIDSGATLEAKAVSKRELDYCEVGTEVKRSRAEGNPGGNRLDNLGKNNAVNDSLIDSNKVDVDMTNLHKLSGMLDYLKVRDEKRRPSVKVEPTAPTANHLPVDSKSGEIPEALELPAVRTVVAAKSPGESAARAEDLRQDGAQVVASRPSCADDAQTRTAGDVSIAACGHKNALSGEGPLPVSLSDNLSKPVQLPPDGSTAYVVPSSPGFVPAEPTDGNVNPGTILQDKVLPPVGGETVEDTASKLSASTISFETKSQGSARTAGHLPASVRGKMHGDRCNPHLQRLLSGAAAQQQAPFQTGQSPVQFSVCGTPRLVHNSVTMAVPSSMKGSSGDDSVSGKQHGQVQQDCISPGQQVSKQGQPSRLHIGPTTAAQKSPARFSETSSPLQPSSVQRIESDQQQSTRAQQGLSEPSRNESSMQAASPKEPKVTTGFNSDTQVSKPAPSAHVTPVICQQARQLNGIGHVYVSRKHRENHSSKDPSGTLTSQAMNSTVSSTKVSVSSLKSPSSGTSSSPTSPLVTTPSSKPQPSVKVPESLPSQKSLSGGSTPNASAPHSASKLSGSLIPNASGSKQVSTLQSSKSTPLPASPQSTKVVSMSKQSARSNSLPGTKSGDGSNSTAKTTGGILSSRGLNHSGSCSSAKENSKHSTHTGIKSASKASEKPAVTKPPASGKSSHSVVPMKGSSLIKQHSGPGSGSSKASSTPSSTKLAASHHSKSTSHKDEKSMPIAPPVPKAMSTMPPPPPPVSTKRSPPTVLTSSVATTLKDEELALLLHQELNSSPRVPRVPRVRQAGVSLQLVSSPFLSSAKGSFVSAACGGPSNKDHHLAARKRTREDRHKDTSKEEVGKSGGKRLEENKMDDEKVASEKPGRNGSIDGYPVKEKSGSVEVNTRHHGFAKGNLSIIVPSNDEGQDGDKKSPAQSNVLTLPGLIDEVLSSRDHQLSYEDVCEAVLPLWPKLRKPNGERYAYPSHRLAVLDCLRNRPAWAHLVGRGPKTNPGRKRRRNEIKSLSDSDDEEDEHLGFRDSDELDTGKSLKRRKESHGEKRAASASEDARKVGRQVRRRRRVEIEDGTDGEDEPVHVTKKSSGGKAEVSKSDDGTSQEEEPEAESSPSSDEEASNYSTDDEEMVVHRGIRNRRRPTGESTSSEDDID